MWDVDEYTPVISRRARFEEKVELRVAFLRKYVSVALLSGLRCVSRSNVSLKRAKTRMLFVSLISTREEQGEGGHLMQRDKRFRIFCLHPQARLADLDSPRRLENLQKLEELKRHLMDLEKQVRHVYYVKCVSHRESFA